MFTFMRLKVWITLGCVLKQFLRDGNGELTRNMQHTHLVE
jgi:hypothetical protein